MSSSADIELITLMTTSDPMQAHLMRAKLESEGVFAFVADEHTIGINPLYSNALGGVRIQIKKEDLDRAREILKLDNSTAAKPECPSCHSKNTSFSKLPSFLNVLSFLSLGVFFPKLKPQRNCNDCHTTWRS